MELQKIIYELVNTGYIHDDVKFDYIVSKLLERKEIDNAVKEKIIEAKVNAEQAYPLKIVDDFETKTPSQIQKEMYILKCGTEVPVYTIENIHDLTQFVGYGKYINSKGYNVFLRGQNNLYDGKMIPSLYRGGGKNRVTYYAFMKRLNETIRNVKSFSKYDKIVFEPMLQHYGIKTTTIDLVDNVWVAMWFGLHETKSVVLGNREHLYISDKKDGYAYIILMGSDAVQNNGGVYEGKTTRLVDLRKVLPSYFLRPHAQHALMLKKKEKVPGQEPEVREDEDYSDLIVGIAKIPVKQGFEWIGKNESLSTSALFPPAYFDYGYRILLEKYPLTDKGMVKNYGSIQIISD